MGNFAKSSPAGYISGMIHPREIVIPKSLRIGILASSLYMCKSAPYIHIFFKSQTPCKGVICHNGGGCAGNHKEGTWQCRCSVNYAGKHCENYSK